MFKVKKECCGKCLFSKDKIVNNDRRKEVLNDCKKDDTHFVCHEGTIKGEDICCKAFYDTQSTNMIRISQRLGMVEFVE
jgi:hypothetical protein